jgi:broad specificity phosphatase PhoE
MRVLVVRHGESTWNAEHRWAGQANPPLSETGRQSALELAARLRDARFDAVACSDLRRAEETALLVAKALGISPPRLVPELRERDAGSWTGRTSDELQASYPGLLERWRDGHVVDPPGCEPWETFQQRVVEALQALSTSLAVERVLVVAHQGVVRALGHHFGVMAADLARAEDIRLSESAGQLTHVG